MFTHLSFYLFMFLIIVYCIGHSCSDNGKKSQDTTIKNVNDAIYFASVVVSSTHLCTGVYIKPLWILTAAQCISIYPVNEYSIYMGTLKASGEEGEKRGAVKVFPHQKFGQVSMSFDIGLIRLERPFSGVDHIGTLDVAKELVIDDKCRIYGWGLTLLEGATLPNEAPIETIEMPIVEIQKCTQYFQYDVQIDSSHICAGVNINVCMADAGSALVCGKRLVGLASSAADCGTKMPSLFTNVPFYYRWIENIIMTEDPDAFNNALSLPAGKMLFSFVLVSMFLK